jgi:hypothetical protein
MFTSLCNVSFVLGFHFLNDILETFRFILVLVACIPGSGEKFGEPFVVAFKSLARCL